MRFASSVKRDCPQRRRKPLDRWFLPALFAAMVWKQLYKQKLHLLMCMRAVFKNTRAKHILIPIWSEKVHALLTKVMKMRKQRRQRCVQKLPSLILKQIVYSAARICCVMRNFQSHDEESLVMLRPLSICRNLHRAQKRDTIPGVQKFYFAFGLWAI